ncbi:MAG: methyltransferase domain-containing protein [candidate division KSB1 bacterium]|nr:methyltransferase domain-containing protein [candidate division KSB1 bacterium]MDZ7366681.1 methyltransferase domain-containing protein [candidate division KSB1 bacterium]MDZ7404691.1 methyltransferase domain-containing protein [candidate division KSB1 bacterium]
MNKRLSEILRCPGCQSKLDLKIYHEDSAEVIAGLLICGCGEKFPVHRGVPRMFLSAKHGVAPDFVNEFAGQLQTDAPEFLSRAQHWSAKDFSFSAQWENYEYSDETWEIKLADRVRFFYRYLKTPLGALNGALVLDAGCGNGTLSAALAASGPEIVAVDFSTSVERAHRHRAAFAKDRADHVHYVQADLQQPPFSRNTFDIIYSDGVLHHTPDTRTSFNALAPLVKSGGKFFVWLYRKDLSLYFRLKAVIILIIRTVLRRFPRPLRSAFCFAVAALMLVVLRLWRWLGFKSRRKIIPLKLKATNLMDTFTPQFKHEHTPAEVKPWFEAQGFRDVEDTTIYELRLGDFGFGMLGVKK